MAISGCSGGGKSTLLAELARRGQPVVEEPGRRIVKEELARGGSALPWTDMEAFLRRVVEMAMADRAAARGEPGWVFFDRGLVDALPGLEQLSGERVVETLGRTNRYHRRVFLAPPWPEIYVTDTERRHGLDEALSDYARLCLVYPALDYELVELPRVSVAGRAEFVLAALGD